MSSEPLKTEMGSGSVTDSRLVGLLDETIVVTGQAKNTDTVGPVVKRADNWGAAVHASPRISAQKKDAAEQNDASDGTPAKVAKSTPKKRVTKAVKQEDGAGSEASPLATPRKRGSATVGDKDNVTPTKKRASGKNPYPTCRAELSEADRMMVEMKKEGKGWNEIGQAYTRITGEPLGKSTLSNRYPKIMAALVEWDQGDIERMLYLKDTISKETEEEIVEFKRKAEYDVWKKIAGRMPSIGGGNYQPEAIEKGYMKEKKENFPHKATVHLVMNSALIGVGQENADADGAHASNTINGAAADAEQEETDEV